MESAMGALFSSGWNLDNVLALTWEQLSFVVYAVQMNKSEMIGILQETIVLSMGGKIEKKKKKKRSKKSRKATDEQKLMALKAMGIGVTREGDS